MHMITTFTLFDYITKPAPLWSKSINMDVFRDWSTSTYGQGDVVSWLWRYKSSIAGSLSWLTEVEHVQISFRSMKPVLH